MSFELVNKTYQNLHLNIFCDLIKSEVFPWVYYCQNIKSCVRGAYCEGINFENISLMIMFSEKPFTFIGNYKTFFLLQSE